MLVCCSRYQWRPIFVSHNPGIPACHDCWFRIANHEVQLHGTYDLYIRKPADYDKSQDKKYPVLYLMDVQWDFKLLDSVIGGLVSFAARNYTGLYWDGRVIEGEGHAGVKPEFYNHGLRFLFSNK